MSPPTRVNLAKRSTSSTSTSANASSTSDNSNNNNTLNAFAHTNGGGLSIGAKAGIVLAALIVTALVLMGILYLMRRTKKARKASLVESASDGSSGSELKEVEGSSVSGSVGKIKSQTSVGEVRQGA